MSSPRSGSKPKRSYRQVARDFEDNPGQLAAYESRGNCVILAGPGSGKTKTLTAKLARMTAEDIRPPRGIACLTYSLECAGELRRRLGELGLGSWRGIFVGTVHSFCFKHIILPYGKLSPTATVADAGVASPETQAVAFDAAVKQVIGVDVNPARYRDRFSLYRRNHPDYEAPDFRNTDPETAALVLDYEARLRAAKLIDFDMMVLDGLRLVERHQWVRNALLARFPVLAVDEYQDLGLPLHRLVLSLCFPTGMRLIAVGDPDQSIYGFSGAQPDLLKELSQRADVEQVRLEFNYRSGQTIVSMSEVALGEPRGYRSKTQGESTIDFHECPRGLEDQATHICETIIPDARRRRPGLALGEIAILYLDKNDGKVITDELTRRNVPFIRTDPGGLYKRTPLMRWLEGCAVWCADGWREGEPRLSFLLDEWLEFLRPFLLAERDARFHRKQLVEFLLAHRGPDFLLCEWLTGMRSDTALGKALEHRRALADESGNVEALQAACREGAVLNGTTLFGFGHQDDSKDRLRLVTLHSAKGLEFDVVIMMGMDQGRIPNYRATTSDSKREPRRLFYVGLTRARHEVHMTYSGGYKYDGRIYRYGPSEFLLEVRDKLIPSSP